MRHFRSSPGDARLREIASKNRACYKRLRKELEELTDHGLRMLKSLQRPGANIMQRLAVSKIGIWQPEKVSNSYVKQG